MLLLYHVQSPVATGENQTSFAKRFINRLPKDDGSPVAKGGNLSPVAKGVAVLHHHFEGCYTIPKAMYTGTIT